MSFRKATTAFVASTLAIAPVAAKPAPAARAAAPTADESELGRGSLLWIAIVIGVIIGAILLLDGDNDPVSP